MASRLIPILLLLVLAGCSSVDVPRPPELDQAVDWESMPDRFGYVSFAVPDLDWACEPEPTSGGWTDATFPFRWLGWYIKQIVRDLVCILLSLAQLFANVFAWLLNALLGALNYFWRFVIFSWLSVRSWFYAAWWILELTRATWNSLNEFIIWLQIWLQTIWAMLLELLRLIAEIVGVFFRVVMSVLGILAWTGGLFIGMFLDLLVAIQGTTVPVQLTGTHPIYRYTRGSLEGFRDSNVGWMLWLAWGLIYVGAIWWAGKFLAEKGKPSG